MRMGAGQHQTVKATFWDSYPDSPTEVQGNSAQPDAHGGCQPTPTYLGSARLSCFRVNLPGFERRRVLNWVTHESKLARSLWIGLSQRNCGCRLFRRPQQFT